MILPVACVQPPQPARPVPPSTDRKLGCWPWRKVADCKCSDRERSLNEFPEWRLQAWVSPLPKDVSQIHAMELNTRELEIIHQDATSLLDHIHKRHYSSVEVIRAYCHAAAVAQDLTNCLTEVFFEEGIQRAVQLDDYFERTGKIIGPLHGLPVSIKDHILIKGQDTATGYVSWTYQKIAVKDAVAVDILRQAGAVLYVKTNNPQTLLSLETNNNIYGRTSNPFNRQLTAGGSSGGESALIASYGSPMGIGTDIGGSIRIPAACTGLYGFKPSVSRMPHAGLLGSHDGMDAIIGALGPLTRSARDLSLFCRVMLQYEPWLVEPPLLEIPWKQDIVEGGSIPTKLCFAVLWDDGVVAPHPPIRDALREVKRVLVAAGHEVIDWEPFDYQEAWDLITKLYFLDGGQEYREVLEESGEPAVPQTEWVMGYIPNEGKPFTVAEIFKLNLQREAFRVKVANYWNNTKGRTGTGRPVDAVLSPVAPTLAPPHDSTRWWGYTSYWNLADYPAVTFPVGRQFHGANVQERNGHEAVARNAVEKFVQGQWDTRRYENAPIGLQLVGRRLNEERLLGILNVVDKLLRSDLKVATVRSADGFASLTPHSHLSDSSLPYRD